MSKRGREKEGAEEGEESGSDSDFGPAAAPDDNEDNEDNDDASISSISSSSDDDADGLPAARLALLGGGGRGSAHPGAGVTAAAWEASGARAATGGSADCVVRLWDFGAMDERLVSFRELEPWAGNHVTALEWGAGGLLAAATGDPRARLYTRDGAEAGETRRGDMYLSDLCKTSGHVAALTAVRWHPQRATRLATASRDGTARVWDAEDPGKCLRVVRVGRPRRAVTAICFSPGGRVLAAASDDGSLHAFPVDGPAQYGRPERSAPAAAAPAPAHALAFSRDNWTVAARDAEAVRLWDVRRLDRPVLSSAEPLGTRHASAGLAFGPTEQVLATCAGPDAVFLERRTLRVVARAHAAEGSEATCLAWSHAANQVLVGAADGTAAVAYAGGGAGRGGGASVEACLARTAPARSRSGGGGVVMRARPTIVAPHELSNGGGEAGGGGGGRARGAGAERDPKRRRQ